MSVVFNINSALFSGFYYLFYLFVNSAVMNLLLITCFQFEFVVFYTSQITLCWEEYKRNILVIDNFYKQYKLRKIILCPLYLDCAWIILKRSFPTTTLRTVGYPGGYAHVRHVWSGKKLLIQKGTSYLYHYLLRFPLKRK